MAEGLGCAIGIDAGPVSVDALHPSVGDVYGVMA